ncbi:hypothetical protein C8Q78DRAFT_201202 [Trametes maxima]|nr:hypothetical protein C8Q78DRAFT_201202 [Trametes maxima]
MERMVADEKGKRSAGLSAWQCRRCTKKPRIEPPAAAPTSPLSIRQPTTPSVIAIDDDIEEVAAPPKQGVVNVPTQTLLPNPPSQHQAAREVTAQDTAATRNPVGAESLPSKPVSHSGNAQEVRFDSTSGRSTQSRLQKHALVVTPLRPPSKQTSKKHPRPPKVHESTSPTARNDTARPTTGRIPNRLTSRTAPAAPPTSISPKDVRELIATMRAKGQLEPPPMVDYILRRPNNSPQPAHHAPPATIERGHTNLRSRTRDLEDVEIKLNDFAMEDDSPGLEPEPEPRPPDPSPDPHNIDDLYGDIAPPYRGDPAPPPRARSVASPPNRLLFAVQKRRVVAQQTPMHPVPRGGDASDARKPRKGVARRLKGSALTKKQAAGLNFDVREVDWGGT